MLEHFTAKKICGRKSKVSYISGGGGLLGDFTLYCNFTFHSQSQRMNGARIVLHHATFVNGSYGEVGKTTDSQQSLEVSCKIV